MHNTEQYDSYSKAIQHGVLALTTTPITPNRRITNIRNVHYSAISELCPNVRSDTTSAST